MTDCPRHGRLLYGTHCTDCDCGRALPIGRVTGFDVSSGPDYSAVASARWIDERYEYRVEVIEALRPEINRVMEEQAEMIRRASRIFHHEWGTDHRFDFHSRRCRICNLAERDWMNGGHPPCGAPELITDPQDPRGIDARRIGQNGR